MSQAPARALPGTAVRRMPAGTWLCIAGVLAFGAILASWVVYKVTHPYTYTLMPVDMHVYILGGDIVRHIRPWYNPHLASPLYDWPGFTSLKLPFTYPPFAALVFSVLSFIPWSLLPKLSVVANVGFLLAALWFTFRGLGYRSLQVRAGATLLAAAAVFWTEPMTRVIYLGQVNLALMALVIWDMTQPDRRWWKGAGVGIATGIKLVPGIFILYLLVTRRFKQAIVAAVTFAATVILPFAVLPSDSAKWWFTGLFFSGGSRAGFLGWEGNQSLRGLTARLLGSLAGSEHAWLAVAVVAVIVGMVCAALLDRKGLRMAGLMAAALTGLLVSPISWDHHWVWILPCVAIAGHYAVQAMAGRGRRWARSVQGWCCWALAAGLVGVFGAWPGWLWGRPHDVGNYSQGLIWLAPGTGMNVYEKFGDRPTYSEYNWHGVDLLVGNAYVLTGIGVIILLLILAWYAPSPSRQAAGVTAAEPGSGRPAALTAAGPAHGGADAGSPAAAGRIRGTANGSGTAASSSQAASSGGTASPGAAGSNGAASSNQAASSEASGTASAAGSTAADG